MDLVHVIIRTVFFYIFILFIFRLMGKREIAKLSIQDLVVSLLIAELVAIAIENYRDSIILTIIPIIILLFFELLASFISLKSNKFRHIIEGKPSLIINKGKINYKELLKQRYSLDDVLLELRNNRIKDLRDIEYAILENNGHLNLFKYNLIKDGDLPFPLILDGVIQIDTLKYLNKDINWLFNYLDNHNINKEDIFYAFYRNKKIYFIKKDELSME